MTQKDQRDVRHHIQDIQSALLRLAYYDYGPYKAHMKEQVDKMVAAGRAMDKIINTLSNGNSNSYPPSGS